MPKRSRRESQNDSRRLDSGVKTRSLGCAIADFDAALKTMPKNAFALYARGVAKIRKNKTAEGETDMAEAVKIAPNIAAPFSARGLAP